MVSDTESIVLGVLLPVPVELWMRAREHAPSKRRSYNLAGWGTAAVWLMVFSLRIGWSKGLAEYMLAVVLGIAVPLFVQLRDRAHMSADERARVWSLATWGPCLLYIGVFTLLAWGWVTRRQKARYWWGPVWLGIALAAIHTAGIVFAVVAGDELEGWHEGYLQAVLAVPVGLVLLLLVSGITSAWRGMKRLVSTSSV
jgi:hypothetical protein